MSGTERMRERGVALVTAMLLMVIGVMLAAQIAWDNQLHVRRATLAADMEQARLFAMGAEAIAIFALRSDYDNYPDETMRVTHDDPETEGQLFDALELPVGIEDQNIGVMYGKLEDLQGRFNLNNLLKGNGNEVNEQAAWILQDLMNELSLDPGLADAIIDWMDNDSIPQPRGAEDGVYTGLNPPYRPPNRGFTHVSELRAVAGIGEQEYRLLRDYVTALPPDGCKMASGVTATPLTPINVNFALPELLFALDNPNAPAVAGATDRLIDLAADSGVTKADLPTILLAGDLPANDQGYVSTVTHCFGLTVYVTIGNSVLSMYSVLERGGISGKEIYVRQRIFGIEDPG